MLSVYQKINAVETPRVLAVSHYLPVYAIAETETHPIKWKLVGRRGHTVLYSGIRSLSKNKENIIGFGPDYDNVVVGLVGNYCGVDKEEHDTFKLPESSKLSLMEALWKYGNMVPVIVDEKTAHDHYEGYCKQILWPLMHYLSWEDAKKPDMDWWSGYKKVNKEFAKTLAPFCKKDTIVWINDYHLFLLPQYLREITKLPKIGLFVHCPFPSSEFFRSLPQREEILVGMLHSNTIGFQTFSYARHLCSSCTRILGLESSPKSISFREDEVQLEIISVGIDVESLLEKSKQQGVLNNEASLLRMYQGKKIIVARDKLDIVSGIVQKLDAFEQFLKMYPEHIGKVVLIQVAQPGQTKQTKLESKISEKINHINSKYGTIEFVPVNYFYSFLEIDMYLALLKVADMGLITSVRDGMNTGSLEFIVCQKNKHSPLVLSEFTGTAGSISSAIKINPWDISGVATAIHDALTMPETEKESRHNVMYKHVMSNNAQFWAGAFINSIYKNATEAQNYNELIPQLDIGSFKKNYLKSKRRLILLDYDGTLVDINKIPSEAVPTKRTISALRELVKDPKNSVWVVSGRDLGFLDMHVGCVEGLGMSAEHGGFIKYPNGAWDSMVEQLDLSWKDKIKQVFEFFTERTNGSFIEEKRVAITWHYRNADPVYANFQCNQCLNHLESVIASSLPVEVITGKKCLEVRPKGVSKGGVVDKLLEYSMNELSWDFVFIAGDDRTDEDMFKVAKEYNEFTNSKSSSIVRRGSSRKNSGASSYGRNGLIDTNESETKKVEKKVAVYTAYVGPSCSKTNASWNIQSPTEVVNLLEKIAEG
ncbi:hypothetical protein BB559_006236 [Furculomyces boomerangus]|uniref:Uncharacterized protein n=1 Tax=Furculomyces boomerangus TaxID=61424 RepID=A0A2T9Y425_9FUNG|nr:hypothetical protein BB559_006366 [Furculomyces boomerangus]PVU87078.1 hypothetical protein BB559_006236 [Furculomyces boomerangus]